jgi:hypothetical protein
MSANIILTKPRSPHMIEFVTDQSDPHFTNVLMRKVKTGAVVCSHLILTSDVQQWQSMYEGDGFKTITNNEDNERK